MQNRQSRLGRPSPTSWASGIAATLIVGSLCTIILVGYLQVHSVIRLLHRQTSRHAHRALQISHVTALCNGCTNITHSRGGLISVKVCMQPGHGSSPHASQSGANAGRHLLRGGLSAARVAYLDKLHHVSSSTRLLFLPLCCSASYIASYLKPHTTPLRWQAGPVGSHSTWDAVGSRLADVHLLGLPDPHERGSSMLPNSAWYGHMVVPPT